MLPSLDIKGCDGACIHAVGFALGRSPALAGQLAQIVGAITSPQEIHLISLQSAHLRLDAHSVDPFAWDHVSGLPDFPGVPVWVTSKEREFIRKSGDMDFCRLFNGIRYGEYGFEGGPYLGFPARHDVYEDGSIVVVPVFGHTPAA